VVQSGRDGWWATGCDEVRLAGGWRSESRFLTWQAGVLLAVLLLFGDRMDGLARVLW
jgi:hypothetical protein